MDLTITAPTPPRQPSRLFGYALGAMTFPASLRLGCALCLCACGPAVGPVTPAHTAPPPQEPAETDWLVETALPALPSDAPEGREPAGPTLVFQSVARNNIVGAAFTADGRGVVALGGDGEASLIDLETGAIRASRRVFVRRAIRGLRVSERGVAYVVNGTSFGTQGGLRAWDLRTGRLRQVPTDGVAYFDVATLAFEERSERIAIAHEVEGQPVLRLQGPDDEARDLPMNAPVFPSFAPGGTLLLRYGDGRVVLRGFEDGPDDERFAVESPGEGEIAHAELQPQGGALFTLAPDGPLVWRDPSDGERVAETRVEHGSPVLQLLVSGDGERLALLREDATLELRSARDGDLLGVTALPEGGLEAMRGSSAGASLDHRGERLLYLARQSVVAVPLRLGSDALGEPEEIPLSEYTSAFVISPDGRWLVVFGRSLTLFDLDASELAATRKLEPRGGEHSVWGAEWMPDESALVSYGRGGVEVWGRDGIRSTECRGTGTVVWTPRPALYLGGQRCDLSGGERTEVPPALAASADGAWVLVDQGSHVATLDGAGEVGFRARKVRGAPVCRYGQCVTRHAISADGATLAYATERELAVHDRRRRLGRLRLQDDASPILGVGLSGDGSAVVVFQNMGSEGLHARTFRVRGMREVADVRAASVEHFAFGPASELLAVANGATVVLLDAESGRTLATYDAGATVAQVEVTPNGRAIVVRTTEGLRVLDRDGAARTARDDIGVPWAVSDDAEKLVHCDAGSLVLTDLLTQATRPLGDCTRGDRLSFSPRGTYVTAIRGASVALHRVRDGAGLALHAPRVEGGMDLQTHPYAVDDEGAFELGPGADPVRFRYRGAGPMIEAPLGSLDAAPARAGLVADFFAAPSPD